VSTAPPPAWSSLRGFLFDVDGTLYDQQALRLLMGLEWARFALGHPCPALEIGRAIVAFRRAREELRALGRPAASLEELQYTAAARRAGMDEARMRAIVDEWIFNRPLRHLRRCRRRGVDELFGFLRERGLAVGVVSDYPGRAKLLALGLAEHVCLTVCATDHEVNAFKPHPGGLAHACRTLGLHPQEVLYVGDRADVDAAGAAALGMPCVILGRRGGTVGGVPFFASSSFHELRSTLGG
jgi:phosphoglycolate phosphatase/putative hydrolase of the HAD superfamily